MESAIQRSASVNVTHNDNTFGPQYGSHFDLTLLFENTILTILPTAVLILLSPFHLIQRRNKAAVSSQSPLLWSKLLFAMTMLCLEISRSIVWGLDSDYKTPSSTAGASLSCVAALCVSGMLILEHRYFDQSSMPMSVYLFLVVVADAIKSRSYLLRPGLHILGIVSAATALVKFILLVLQEIPKDVDSKDKKSKKYNQESTGGFWNRTLVVWINSTLLLGFRQVLKLGDLAPLGLDFSSKRASDKFDKVWERANKDFAHALLRATTLTLLGPFMAPVIPRLCLTGFQFASPLVMKRILDFVDASGKDSSDGTEPSYIRAGLTTAFVVVYAGIAITKSSNSHLMTRHTTQLRGLLISQVLKKNLRLPHLVAQQSASLTHISADVEGILINIGQFHGTWVAILEVGLAVYYLYTSIGSACFLPIITVAISVVSLHALSKRMRDASEVWAAAIQKRVAKTVSVLSEMKSIKIIGIEPVVTKYIQDLREKEIECSIKARRIEVVRMSLLPLVFAFTPLVTFAGALYWTTLKDGMDPVTTFVVMAYLFLIYQPLFFLFNCWPALGTAVACSKRLQQFLLTTERCDSREILAASRSQSIILSETPVVEQGITKLQSPGQRQEKVCLVFANVTVNSRTSGIAVIKDVNISIAQASLVLVVGPVATGKSVFLKTILGETNLAHGKVLIGSETFAFCDQKPWLPNLSIRDVIVGENEYEEARYLEVLYVCMLEDDIQQLADGHQTLVGSNGIALSGGQKQRLATARAIYSKATVLVLDDIVSALDRLTAAAMFVRLFGPQGLLKRQQRTAIIATHSVEYLTSADQVLVLDRNGSMVSKTPDMVMRDMDFSATLEQHQPRRIENDTDQPSNAAKEVERLEIQLKLNEQQNGDAKLYTFFLQAVPKCLLVVFLILLTTVAFIERSPQIYMRVWVDKHPQIREYVVGLAVIAAFSVCANAVAARVYLIQIIPIISRSLHDMFLHSIMGATLPYLASTGVATLINRTSQDMTLVSQELPLAFYRVVYIVALVLIDTGVVVAGAEYAGVMIPIIFALLYLVQFFYLRTSRQMRHLDLEAKTPMIALLSETITGLEHIRCFGWEERVLDNSLRLLDNSQKPYYYLLSLQRWLGLVLDSCATAVGGIIVAIAVNWPKTTSQSSLGLSLLGIFAYSVALMALVERWTLLETSLGAVARLRSFIHDTPQEEDKPEAQEQPASWPQSGTIEFKNVCSKYKFNGKSQTALENLTANINPGQKVAIIGRTGSGKSSILLTLLNFLDHDGTMLIDGIDITHVPRAQLRRVITTIPQDPVFIPGTLRENMVPMDALKTAEAENVADELIIEALTSVGLWEYILSGGGLDAQVEDLEFSAGQKQLASMARAILHHRETQTKIVLMDEATSNIDPDTEKVIQQLVESAFAGCTRLVIAHREATYEDCDVLLEMRNGRMRY